MVKYADDSGFYDSILSPSASGMTTWMHLSPSTTPSQAENLLGGMRYPKRNTKWPSGVQKENISFHSIFIFTLVILKLLLCVYLI